MDEPKKQLRPSDLTPAQTRTLRGLSKAPATKLTKTVKQLIEVGLVREFQSPDKPVMYCRTTEGVRLAMDLHRVERMLYTVDSNGRRQRRPWK